MANGHASRISIREIFSSIKLLNTVLQLPLRVLYHFFFPSITVLLFLVISRLVTRRNASRGDLFKKEGVRFGGRVRGLRDCPVPDIPAGLSHTRTEAKRSMFSVDTGRMPRCFGYHPRAGTPVIRSISLEANA